jgi:hypothetical protein
MILQLTIPPDLEEPLSRLQPNPETAILNAIRQLLATRTSPADDHDLEMAAITDTSDSLLTPTELAYYLALD